MRTSLKIQLKEPCKKNYNQFKKTTKGGFCNSCEKEVIDFTKMSKSEIANYLSNYRSGICGRFASSQLKASYTKQNKYKTMFKGLGLAIISLFSIGNLHAQKSSPNANNEIQLKKDKYLIKGVVNDNSGALPGVSIYLKGTKIGTETDFNGKFVFPKKLKKGDVIIFSYLGYKTKEVKVDKNNKSSVITLEVDFENDNYILMGAIEIKKRH